MFNDRFKSKTLLGDLPILVIEPNANYRMTMKGFLQNFGIKNVKFTHSSKEAQNLLLTTDPGIIICEWNQPDVNGIQLCKELKSQPRYANVPFLLLSVENLKKDVSWAVVSMVLKPFSQQEFETSLQQAQNDKQIRLTICLPRQNTAKRYKAKKLVETVIKVKPHSARGWQYCTVHRKNGQKDMAKIYLKNLEINRRMDAIAISWRYTRKKRTSINYKSMPR